MESYVSEEFESRLLPIPLEYTDMFTDDSLDRSVSGSIGSAEPVAIPPALERLGAGEPPIVKKEPVQGPCIMLPVVKVTPTKRRRIAPVKRGKPRNPYTRLITTGEPSIGTSCLRSCCP